MQANRRRARVASLVLCMASGVGLAHGQSSVPNSAAFDDVAEQQSESEAQESSSGAQESSSWTEPEQPAEPPGAVQPSAPPQGAPQAGAYPQGYPPGYSPPPGYGYPPPGYYPYPPADSQERESLPSNAAVRSSPFFDLLVGGFVFEDRIDSWMALSVEAGLFIGDLLRISLLAGMPMTDPNDNFYDSDSGSYGGNSPSPDFIWGGNVGLALVSSSSFVMSPGVRLIRTEVSDYGNALMLHIPFEWVRSSGMRIGFDVSAGRAFGGGQPTPCPTTPCAAGDSTSADRPAGSAFFMNFLMGFGLRSEENPSPRAAP
jgi:hypothetical protein